jgi:hypothetical protein
MANQSRTEPQAALLTACIRTPPPSYRAALDRYDSLLLTPIAAALSLDVPARSRVSPAGAIAERLQELKLVERLIAGLPHESKLLLGLIALSENPSWPLEGLKHAASCLGVEPRAAIRSLLDLGLLALETSPFTSVFDFDTSLMDGGQRRTFVSAHPVAMSAARTVLPAGERLPASGPVRLVREADGLEPILRIAAVWQRVADAPLRQTQQGTFYKRDRERLEDDPVLAGPIADALEPLPDMPAFWLSLGQGVAVLQNEAGSERVTASSPDYWLENAYHLPRMIAVQWLGLRTWHEQGGFQQEGTEAILASPFVRSALLFWLATLDEGEWVAIEDFARFLQERSPRWDRPTCNEPVEALPSTPRRGRSSRTGRAKGATASDTGDASLLETVLLGAAYQLGLVRAAEEVHGGRRTVQLTALGRYLLALGPPPPSKPEFVHFLFVQPNFEVIAYRQGLTPALIGQFSRFALWTQLGAALAMRLTPESIYRGLEGGLTPEMMLDQLARHTQRPLPVGVAETLRTWAERRERVTYHTSTTLIEFASSEDLEDALRSWPDRERAAPVKVSERILLVQDETSIPFARFRMTGARDYRRPPEVCVEVEPDGVTLTLDLARSDLLVDAELSRFADESPTPSSRSRYRAAEPRRRFVVTAESLARAAESGVTPAQLSASYLRRTGRDVPPSVRLMALAASTSVPLTTARPLILRVPTADVLDGLTQHPSTRDFLGERLGPTSIIVLEDSLSAFREALTRIGLRMDGPGG